MTAHDHKPLDRPPTRDEIQLWLIAELPHILDDPTARVVSDTSFEDCGMDSLQALDLVRRLEDWTGSEVPPSLPYEYTDVSSLATKLAELLGPGTQ